MLGDFVWSASRLFVPVRTGQLLENSVLRGFELIPTRQWQDPKLQPPKSPKRVANKNRRIWLSDETPDLFEVWPTRWGTIDLKNSATRKPIDCAFACGGQLHSPRGIEWIDANEIRHPRRPGMGFAVSAKSVSGSDFYRLTEWPHVLFASDAAKSFIEDAGLSNIAFYDHGELF